jgi:hypothetical protein
MELFTNTALLIMFIGVPALLLWAATGKGRGRSKTKVGYVLANGRVSWQGKHISLAEAQRKNLRLAYGSQPRKRKRNILKFW